MRCSKCRRMVADEDYSSSTSMCNECQARVTRSIKGWMIAALCMTIVYTGVTIVGFGAYAGFLPPLKAKVLEVMAIAVAILFWAGSLFAHRRQFGKAWRCFLVGGVMSLPLGLVLIVAGRRLLTLSYEQSDSIRDSERSVDPQTADPAKVAVSTDAEDLRGVDRAGWDLRGADFRGADFRHANVQGASFQNADLLAANLQEADLRGANLKSANLQHANLSGALFSGADLRRANLTNSRELTPEQLLSTRDWRGAKLPRHLRQLELGHNAPEEAMNHLGRTWRPESKPG